MSKPVFRQLFFGFGLMDIDALEDKIDQLINEVCDKNQEIKELKDRNEQLVDEGQNLEGQVDNLEEEVRDFKTEIDEYKDEIKDKSDEICTLEDDIGKYKHAADSLDQLAYKSIIALYIVRRFIPDKYKDLVNIHMMMELKDNIDHFIDEQYDILSSDINYNGSNKYKLPIFDDKEEFGEQKAD